MATDFAEANRYITALLQDNIGSTVDEVEYENFQSGESALENSNVDSWARLSILPGTSVQGSLGQVDNRLYRNTGLVVIQVFIKRGIWTKTAYDAADAIAAIYRGKTDNGIIYGAASVSAVGPSGGWFQVNVTVPYRWDSFS